MLYGKDKYGSKFTKICIKSMSQVRVGLIVDRNMSDDRIFDLASGRDNVLERFCLLRESLYINGMECRTIDMFELNSIDILIFNDIMNHLDKILKTIKANPLVQLIYVPNEPSFVIPLHDETILPQLPVDIVLTWNDQIASRFPHVIKCNIGQPVITEEDIPMIAFNEKKFMCSIFAYKPSVFLGTLFGERINIVDFFSRQKLGIDLYGIGWNSSPFSFVSFIYKGPCKSKKDILKKYKFSVAYENIGTLPGLITEKLFDCFSAGTIPLYLGAPNIHSYIPSSCFIDVRDFKSSRHLYEYLENMTEERYQQYLDAVKSFIKTSEYNSFTSSQYAKIMVEQINVLVEEKKVTRTLVSLKWQLIKLIVSCSPRILRNWRAYKCMVIAVLVEW
jgi:hypothetical protein